MCAVSAVLDHFHTNWPPADWPRLAANPFPTVTRAEHEALKAQVAAMRAELEALKDLVKAAKRYDEATGQNDCEHADKVALIRQLAEALGVDMTGVLP